MYAIPARGGKQTRDNNIGGNTLNSRHRRTNRHHSEQNQVSDHEREEELDNEESETRCKIKHGSFQPSHMCSQSQLKE